MAGAYRGKRALDLFLVVCVAPVWVVVLLVLAVLVRFKLGAPVFFVQERSGLGGRPFRLYKFRTMIEAVGSDREPLPDAQRMTPFGRQLRSSSLDELPELLNVLRGEMSLVGPRPLLPRYLQRYSPYHLRRHLVLPGVTGLTQVRGRNALSWPAKFDLDVEYVSNASFWLDIQILFCTVRAVLTREGISASGDATMPEFLGYE